ncbi:MAG: RNA polymerase sigma factor [Pseudomonadales bacterium]|nr:RNA polymerase sigma factor [Pseudomonadales bacterium]
MISREQLNQLYRYAYSLTHNEDTAFDLVHDNVEKFLKSEDASIKEPLHFIMRCIRNSYIDDTRKHNLRLIKHEEIRTTELIVSPDLDEVLVSEGETDRLLQSLQPEERELIYLTVVEEYTVQEVSDMKNVPRGTLLSKLHRIKKSLKQKLLPDADNSHRISAAKGEPL